MNSESEEADEGEQAPAAERHQDTQAEDDLHGSEEAPIRLQRNPRDPTSEERERHWRTHLPYRAWCPVCVKARGREDEHRAGNAEEEDGVSEVAMDYCKVGSKTLLVGRERELNIHVVTWHSARALKTIGS